MKALDARQLGIIEAILVNTYSLKYDDLRIEILDHIASEVEVLIDQESMSYDQALKAVFKFWHRELQPKKLGSYKNTPRMVVAIWRRLDLKYFGTLIVICAVVFSVLYQYDIDESDIKGGVVVLLIVNFFILMKTISQVFNSSQKTVWNEYVKKGILACLGFNVYLTMMSFIWNRPEPLSTEIDWGIYVSVFLALSIFIRLLLGYFWMKKSLVIEGKYCLLQ